LKKSFFVTVPAKTNIPETNLYVQITHQDEKSLQTKPYVFMLPGGPGANHSHYMDYDCLQDVANIIYYDPRGCGLSDKSEQSTYTMNNYINDVRYVIHDELKLEQVILLGKSYGAMCALGYTQYYPENVSKLILAAGSPSFHNLKTGKSHVLARGTKEQKKICEKLWRGAFQNNEDVADYFKIMEPFYSWKRRNNQPVNRPKPQFPFAFEPLNEAFRTNFWKFNFVVQLPEIQCPTLILVGNEDWITDPIYSKQMAEKIPQSSLKIFKKADHSLESDVPEAFFSTIREFINN
jgi:proline iminopeptidase